MWGTPNTQKICALQHSSDRGVRRWFSTSKYYRTPLVCLIFLPPFTSQTPAICGHLYNILEPTVLYINRDGSKSSFVIIKTMNPNRCWQNNQTVNLNGPNLKGSFTQGEWVQAMVDFPMMHWVLLLHSRLNSPLCINHPLLLLNSDSLPQHVCCSAFPLSTPAGPGR